MPFDFYIIRRRTGDDGHERREFLRGPYKLYCQAVYDIPGVYESLGATGDWEYSTFRLPHSPDNPKGKLNP